MLVSVWLVLVEASEWKPYTAASNTDLNGDKGRENGLAGWFETVQKNNFLFCLFFYVLLGNDDEQCEL